MYEAVVRLPFSRAEAIRQMAIYGRFEVQPAQRKPFDTLAAALAFKLAHETGDVRIDIFEVDGVRPAA